MAVSLVVVACTHLLVAMAAVSPSVDGRMDVDFVSDQPAPVGICNTSVSTHRHMQGSCSQILPSNVSTAVVNVSTAPTRTSCRYSLHNETPFAHMTPFDQGAGGTLHTTVAKGLNINSSVLNTVHIRCQEWQDADELKIYFRNLPSLPTPYPRIGNLWGSYNFEKRSLSYAAERIDLWLGADWTADQFSTLRALNPATKGLTSINAVEHGDGLPDRFYLHNASNRARLESWPGAYRLDLTRPEVSLWKAYNMYELILHGGDEGHPAVNSPTTLLFDGIFVDNVFLTQSWANRDINGNPFYPDTTGDGKPDDPKEFDAKWRAGVILELNSFREKMPHALMSGHAMDPHDPAISSVFNAISIGFMVPRVVQGYESFLDAWSNYQSWMKVPREPHITMIEGAPALQLGYGYGFDTQITHGSMPPATLNFSRDFFQFMRFGLAMTLLDDAYYAYELGDSWHGQDWDYDEYKFDLGQPTSDAYMINAVRGPAQVGLDKRFQLWVTSDAAANLTWDTADKHSTNASARVNVVKSSKKMGSAGVDLFLPGLSVTQGQNYEVTFWAKSNSSDQVTIELDCRRDGPDWAGLGLDTSVWITSEWAAYSAAFVASNSSTARVSFWLGAENGIEYWIDSVSIVPIKGIVMARNFTKGAVILNTNDEDVTISLGQDLKRFQGQGQAPFYQYIVDDADTAHFHADDADWKMAYFEGGYNPKDPSSEENKGPYFHQWASSARVASNAGSSATSAATWTIGPRDVDEYTIKAWWPASPEATAWCTHAKYQVLQNGATIASATLDQTPNGPGGDIWATVAANVKMSPGVTVSLECPPACKCVADALLIESRRRYNDGSDASSVWIGPRDGVLLQRN